MYVFRGNIINEIIVPFEAPVTLLCNVMKKNEKKTSIHTFSTAAAV